MRLKWPAPGFDGPGMLRGVTLALLLVSLLLVAGTDAGAQEVYSYVDESGRTHYTDSYASVPERHRSQVRRADLELGLEPSPGNAVAAEQAQPSSGRFGGPAWISWDAAGVSLAVALLWLLVALPLMLALCSLLLMLACRIGGEPVIGFGKGMLACLVMLLLQSAATMPLQVVVGSPEQLGTSLLWLLASLVITLAAYAAVLRGMHCDTAGAALKVSVLYVILPALIAIGFVLCGFVIGMLLG